jgi:hypothetical protein
MAGLRPRECDGRSELERIVTKVFQLIYNIIMS